MKKSIIVALLTAMMPAAMLAVPAKRGVLVFNQPDGSTISLRKTGDERSHIVMTSDGFPVVRDANGFYCYADFGDEGRLKPTSVKVKAAGEKLTAAEQSVVSAIDMSGMSNLLETRNAMSKMSVSQMPSRSGSQGIGLMDDAFLGRSELKGLVILAQYEDVKFSKECDREFFVDMLNREGFDQYEATGSAKDYFIDASTGQFVPEFDVYGPVTLPNPMAYYGGNNAYGNDKNAARMIYDACVGLDEEIDFSEYDLDGDGYVDNVFVFYAGYGEASYGTEDSVWPHQWSLESGNLTLNLDGVTVNKYACSNELERDNLYRSVPGGIGTFVHEFSHVLGLPDLYVTTGSMGEWTPGSWDVLDQGSYNNNGRTPPSYSIYERNALGWLDPVIIEGPDSIALEAINLSNRGCIIPTGNVNEFFLLENRQQVGWDTYLPGHGMLIWHIDYNSLIWQRNSVNSNQQHNYVDIEEARGSWAAFGDFLSYTAYYQALADYAFPGSMGVTSFTDDTEPSMKTWAGKGLSLPITDIAENDGLITFNVAGGRCETTVPVVTQPTEFGEGWFEAAWLPSDGAVGYELSVKAFMGENKSESETLDFSTVEDGIAVLPDGWTYTGGAGAVFTDAGYFGQSSPSLKLSKTGAGIVSRLYDADITGIEFWMKGFSTNAKSVLKVEALIGEEWEELETVAPTRNSGTVHKIGEIPEGVRQVRLVFNQSLGNVAIDDLTVTTTGGGFRTLPGYGSLQVGNVCNYKVDNLIEGVDVYSYKVCAIDVNGRRTDWSDEQIVNISDNAGIGDVDVDSVEAVTVDGRCVAYKGRAGADVSLCDLNGRVLVTALTGADGCASLYVPAAGIYVLTTSSGAHKVFVR